LLTNLANTVQPLIRYDLGDQVTFHSEPCRCGSPLPTFDVRGRQDDALVMAGSQGRRVTLLPLALTTVLEDQASVFDFQLRQKDDHTLTLRLGSRHPDAPAAMARSRMALKAYARAQGVASMCVEDELGYPLTRGRSGKVRRVVGEG
jgi:phenylacetate-CoA ligase